MAMSEPTWKAGPDCRPRECRCGVMSSERTDCDICEQTCCPKCAEPVDPYKWVCHDCLKKYADEVEEAMLADAAEAAEIAALAEVIVRKMNSAEGLVM